MGYNTKFVGSFDLDKPLTTSHASRLLTFTMGRHEGSGFPGYYCQWIPSEDGTKIEYDGEEKFYDYVEWIKYLIDNFLSPWGYTLNGRVKWHGDEFGDEGVIVVENNEVSTIARKTLE